MVDKKLDNYLSSYGSFNNWLIQQRYTRLKRFFNGRSCLELGIAEGTGVKDLLAHFEKVTIVDGSKLAVEKVRKKYPESKLTCINTYFENMDLKEEKFDTVIMAHILEHVDNPQVVLKQAKQVLNPGGTIIIDVPNGDSLHRQLGVEMGLLEKRTQLNEADISIGHQRVYTPQTFQDEVLRAGLRILDAGGMFVKIVSNSQTEKYFDKEQLEALIKVGEDNPKIAAEIYIIAQ